MKNDNGLFFACLFLALLWLCPGLVFGLLLLIAVYAGLHAIVNRLLCGYWPDWCRPEPKTHWDGY